MKGFLSLVALVSVALAAPSDNIPDTRIIGGENAIQGEFPYQASVQGCILGILCSHICGGTIISPTAILTAAHCYSTLYSYRVIVGVTALSETTASRQVITATDFLVHPAYPGGSTVAPDDIGIIRLAQSIAYSTVAQPARLPIRGNTPTGSAVLSGWGSTGTSSPDHLQKAIKGIIGIQECESALQSILPGTTIPLDRTGGNVCTSGRDSVSACSGDSGGPLAQGDVVIGVVSWGISPCGTPNAPSVFVAVNHYVDWIEQNCHDLKGEAQTTYRLRTY